MPRKEFEAFTRLDASDVNTFLMDQSVMSFAGTAARGSAIPTPVEGMVAYLEDSNTIEAYNSTAWVTVANAGTASYNLVQTLYFTSSGTFTKATYPWLRAINVKVQSGGGGGTGQGANGGSGQGGGGGGTYGEKFITDIASLDASITVTRGDGGAGGVGGFGSNGGTSSFGSIISATGGTSPTTSGTGGVTGSVTGGDLEFKGSGGVAGSDAQGYLIPGGAGGSSYLGGGAPGARNRATNHGQSGFNGSSYGGGGGGSAGNGTHAALNGGNGAPGIVIVEIYA
jgi:hypothetical protein